MAEAADPHPIGLMKDIEDFPDEIPSPEYVLEKPKVLYGDFSHH